MKKIWLIVAGVVAIIMVGIYIYLATIDWNKHKDKIAEQFSSVTGKNVVFDGPLSFKLLPRPYLAATDIKVYSAQGHYQTVPLAKIEQMVASLELLPLIFGGGFKVERMSLVNPEITFEIMEDGTINWQSEQVYDDTFTIQDVEVSLDSVTIEKAKVNFLYPARNIDYVLENLNAEVIAENIAGPYRIEGSYIKDNSPEGFAISLGQFSESFATSVNLVLTQPAYETYFHFDGTVLFKNDAVNGSVVFESNKLYDFVNANLKNYKMEKECDQPLAVSLEVNTSPTKIDFNNVVVKYGNTLGAGNMAIPIQEKNPYGMEEEEAEPLRKKIEFGFKMTEFDMKPFVYLIKQNIDKYSDEKSVFDTDLGFDLIVDIHAVKAEYNEQTVRELDLSFDILDNELKVHNFKAIFPGETTWTSKGSVFQINDALTYGFENSFTTNNLAKFISWIGYELPNEGEFTYKKANASFNTEGNLKNVKIKPFNLNVDKTVMTGEVGVVRGERNNVLTVLNIDSLNFDTYVKQLPQAEMQKEFADRMVYRFSKLGFLNDFDARGSIRLGLGIYDNTPFENSVLDFNLDKGVLDLEEFKIGNIANSVGSFKGVLKGFGGEPSFENIKYEVEGTDITSVLNKLGITPPDINFKDLKAYNSKGIITGKFDRVALRAISKLGNIDSVFSGELARRDGKIYLNGDLEVRAPDFVKFVNDLNYRYSPTAFTLGLFTMKTKFVGSLDKFKATSLNANIGTNNFQGAIVFDGTTKRNNIVANIVANKFEVDRFFYSPVVVRSENKVSFKPAAEARGDFLSKPYFDKDKINYNFFTTFDVKGKMKVARLSYKGEAVTDTEFDLSLLNSEAQINNFKGNYDGSTVTGLFGMMLTANPILRGDFKVEGKDVREIYWSGNKYGLTEGKMNAGIKFVTNANSFDDMVSGMDAQIGFDISNPMVKGWDISAIYDDLKVRNKSEGFVPLAYDALQKSETRFNRLAGEVTVTKGTFIVSNTRFEGDSLNINAGASGSLITWDMNSKFELSFLDLEKVPPLIYMFVGPISSPKLSIDASAITSSYDSHWEKVAEEKKAQEISRAEALNNLMDEQQQKAFDLRTRIQREIKPDYDVKSKLAENKEMVNLYKGIGESIDKVQAGIEDIFAQALVKDFDEKFIQELDRKNLTLSAEVDAIQKSIENAYSQDVKYRINDDFSKIVSVFNISKSKITEYRDRYSDYVRRLVVIKTEYSLDDDDMVKTLRDNIEQALLDIDAVASQARRDYIVIQTMTDLGELENQALSVRALLTQSEDAINKLDKDITDMYSYLDKKVAEEETIYNKKVEEDDVKKKLEENTGKISTGRGKDITVIRDIQDINKAEEAASKEGVKVLDFSKSSSYSSKTRKEAPKASVIPSNTEDNIKKLEEQTGFIREISGEPVEAGGVIKKQ